jgi:hypothetical protein
VILSTEIQFKTGVATDIHNFLAANQICASKTCPIFILETTQSGFNIISIGVPSCVNGISSIGTTMETIHLFQCLQAILSQTSIFLV